jgi:hypothetical protein
MPVLTPRVPCSAGMNVVKIGLSIGRHDARAKAHN